MADPKQTISPEAFKEALGVLGWSYAKCAEELGIHSRHRVSDWARGRRPVPKYIAKSLAVQVDLHLKRRGL